MDSVVDIIRVIQQQPGLYLTGNSINLLNAFLSGYIIRDPSSICDIQVMAQFQKWIEEKYDKIGSHSWVKIILFYSHDEFDALDNFFKDFNRFMSERNMANSNVLLSRR